MVPPRQDYGCVIQNLIYMLGVRGVHVDTSGHGKQNAQHTNWVV